MFPLIYHNILISSGFLPFIKNSALLEKFERGGKNSPVTRQDWIDWSLKNRAASKDRMARANQHLVAAHTVNPVEAGAKNRLTTSITFLALVIGALDT